MDDNRLSAMFSALTSEDGEPCLPFRWQLRLLHRFLAGDLPTAVDLPTGLGKTSVMALWLIALAKGASLPRRLVYVVDRRAVVDQATRFAELLRCNIPDHLANSLHVNDGFGGFPISTLRGGFTDNRDWLEDPSKPAIVVGTIDMVGSRLLFSGYGVSRRMRPYHAGLLGADVLVVLDEAHLCPPFEALLRRIADQRDSEFGSRTNGASITPPFRLMSLSATGRETAQEHADAVFRLNHDDRAEPVVEQRLTANKRLKVSVIAPANSLIECLADRAIELGDGEVAARVLIFCDSRKDAVAVKERIDRTGRMRRKAGKSLAEYATELLVGERRVYERTALESWLSQRGFLGGASAPPATPAFLVATSAGEVGVDLNAEHMVCDLVAYERMVQRLGRVNRRGGRNRAALVEVFAVRPEAKETTRSARDQAETDLPSFNQRLAPLCRLSRGDDGRHDASPGSFEELKSRCPDIIAAATTAAPLHPELTRPLLDAWSMTSLRQHEGRPEIAPWLRGWEQEEEPQTSVVWRTHLPCIRTADTGAIVEPAMVAEYFRAAPIHASERLEAPASRVFDWLLSRVAARDKRAHAVEPIVQDDDVGVILIDHTGELVDSAKWNEIRQLAAPAKRLSKAEQRQRDRRKQELRDRRLPGSTLVVDARISGLHDGMLDAKADLQPAVADVESGWREPSRDARRPLITFRVEQITGGEDGEGLRLPADLDDDWCHVRTFETHFDSGGGARRGLAVFKWRDGATDEDSRSIGSAPQSVRDHALRVVAHARELAQRLDLSEDDAEALVTAACLHDEGKAAIRWQNAMNAPRNGRPYAKTRGGGNWHLLEGYRHEFGSLLRAERLDLPDGTRDLTLHVIAAHHGNARPLISSSGCEDGPPSLLMKECGSVALRFARMQKRYGPWGLAWREAILRSADQKASRESSPRHEDTDG